MRKTFWAIEITLTRIEADVNDFNVTTDDGASSKKHEERSHYDGSFSEVNARSGYEQLNALMKTLQRRDEKQEVQ